MHPSRLALAFLLLASAHLRAQTVTDRADPTNKLPLPTPRQLKFTTSEGTWMSLDVSPDGRTIVFDLLGDIYTLPIEGGKATRITFGNPHDMQPRFSPDGKTIAFVSDRDGNDNVWLMSPDGGNLRQLTKEKPHFFFLSPEWTPDGRRILVTKNPGGAYGSFELWMYDLGGGTGLKLKGGGEGPAAQNYIGAAYGKDPERVWLSTRTGVYQFDMQLPGFQVSEYNLRTGTVTQRTSRYGGGVRPTLSSDDKWLVYGSRQDTVTQLRLLDLETGDESVLMRRTTRDDQEGRWTMDLLPGMSFTPDNKSLITTADGGFWRIEVPSGKATKIPFTADVDLRLAERVRFDYPINDTVLTVTQIRTPQLSPDGKRLVFTALDRLWMMDYPSGTPRRLTNADMGEHYPSWSPDGAYVAYVGWTERGGEGGAVYRVAVGGGSIGTMERLTTEPGFYDRLTYSPSGTRIVVVKGPRLARLDEGSGSMDLVWIPATGGRTTRIAPIGRRAGMPHFSSDTSRILITENGILYSIRFDGTDRSDLVKAVGYTTVLFGSWTRDAEEILLSPNGDQALVDVNENLFLMPVLPSGGKPATVTVTSGANAIVPVRRITSVIGEFPSWSADGKSISFSAGRSVFRYDLAAAGAAIRDSIDRASAGTTDTTRKPRVAYEVPRTDVVIRVPKDRPAGVVALRNARIITMKGDEVIASGTIVVTNNRITAIGPSGRVKIPSGARVIDVSGKTIMPGMVDVHAHMHLSITPGGVHETQAWSYLANLAYGVTTIRDPQTGSTDVFSYKDLVDAGQLLGPRVYTTGPGVSTTENPNSIDAVRDIMRRYSRVFNSQTFKEYMTGERIRRQWVTMVAKEESITSTHEGGVDFRLNITHMFDGYAGQEHSLPIYPIYSDVAKLAAFSGITYTPTLLVNYGGPMSLNYWIDRTAAHNDPKLRRWIPERVLDSKTLRRTQWFSPEQYTFRNLARDAAKIVAAGGRVGLGGHGEMQGLGVHWELWSIASGGMSRHDALRVATLWSAESIGLGKDLGSLEVGKLADLIILEKNPLINIENTNTIKMVMKNGRLYDGDTLDELWPKKVKLERFAWDRENESR
jgi:Tol biopolymer transport system component/imidazolonepropionase-like amidohydrolase